jgi:curli production assembly/transport component CsgF
MIFRKRVFQFLVPAILSGGFSAWGTEMVYAPIIPAFGGNPNNASGLNATATAQNPFKAPTTTPLQNFNAALQQAILNKLSTQSIATIFGSGSKLIPGTYDTSGYTIEITDNGNGTLKVKTTDKTTGASVEFIISSNGLDTGP